MRVKFLQEWGGCKPGDLPIEINDLVGRGLVDNGIAMIYETLSVEQRIKRIEDKLEVVLALLKQRSG